MSRFKNSSKPVVFTFLYFLNVSTALAASTEFFTRNDKWEKANSAGVPAQDALDLGFTSALQKQGGEYATGAPLQPILRRTLFELTHNLKQADIELGQTMLVGGSGIVKFVATEEGIVSIDTVSPDAIRLTGRSAGRTFVHVWDGSGRNTFSVQVVMPKFVYSPTLLKQKEAIEKTRSFEVEYNITHGAFYTGDKWSEINRTSSDLDQLIEARGDTPYGFLRGHMQAQRFSTKTVFNDIQLRLEDGKVGRLDRFNVALGDSPVAPGTLVFPEARIRGVDFEKWSDRYNYEVFYGREQSSIIGVVTPGFAGGKNIRSSFLSGNTLTYKVNDGTKVKGGIYTGAGRSRTDELNRKGYALSADSNLTKNIRFNPEVDFDNEHFAQKHAVYLGTDRLKIKNEVRDISKKFETMIGSPSRQGELGELFDMTYLPTDRVTVLMTLDTFRDRLIPNPENPDYWNFHKDARLIYAPYDRTTLTFNVQDYDDTGRIGPSKQRTMGAQLNQGFDFFSRRVGSYIRYQNRGNRLLNNSSLNYVQNQVALGVQLKIFWGLDLSVEQEWNHLEEPVIRRITHPKATTVALDYRRRLWDSPFYIDSRVRFRDEDETESINSFMRGEDSVEFSGGLYYREYENMEIFFTGSIEAFEPESNRIQSTRVEAQFLTGARYLWDTGKTWSAVGSFEGFVYKDLNGDGVRSPDEPGLPGLKVSTGDGQETLTDRNGYYDFRKVAGKKTSITLQNDKIPYGYVPTSSVRQERLIVQNGKQQIDFGLTPRSEVTGIVYNDLNGNGKYDLTDKGVRKVRVAIDTGGAVKSNNLGVYSFSNVLAGKRVATIDVSTLPEGYVPLDVPRKEFELFEGIRYELNFPLRAQRAVSGQVFTDDNANTAIDVKEKPTARVKVRLGERSMVTDAEGYYLFDEVNSGPFELSVDSATVPAGYRAPESEIIDMPLEPSTVPNRNIGLLKGAAPEKADEREVGRLEDPEMKERLQKKITPPVEPVATLKTGDDPGNPDTPEDILKALDDEEPQS